jgi:hypothetical protein
MDLVRYSTASLSNRLLICIDSRTDAYKPSFMTDTFSLDINRGRVAQSV